MAPKDEKAVDPKDNTLPGLILGIQAIIGTIWWLFNNFFYIKNKTSDPNLRSIMGFDTLPVGWFWERMSEDGGTDGWVAASLFCGWMGYLIISVVELVAWIVYEFGSLGFAEYYFSTVGYWGSIVILPWAWIMACVHIGVYGTEAFPSAWAVFLLVVNAALWLMIGLLHIFYIDDFMAYIAAQEPTVCECSQPPVPALPDKPTPEIVVARQSAMDERKELCKLECPAEDDKADEEPAAEAEEDDVEEEESSGW